MIPDRYACVVDGEKGCWWKVFGVDIDGHHRTLKKRLA